MTEGPRGFARMTPEQRAELGARGGARAHELGTAHKWSVDEAHEAGRRGGRRTQKKRASANGHEEEEDNEDGSIADDAAHERKK